MSVRTRVSRWRWVRRLIRWLQASPVGPPLREFVYLDDVSVYSLLASQVGAHTEQITESFSKSQRDQFSSGATVGLDQLRLSSSATSEQTVTQGTQVLRKATVQASFKALSELTEARSVLRPVPTGAEVPKVSTIIDLESRADVLAQGGWAVQAHRLERGQLLEMEVALSPEAVFHAKTVFSTFLDMTDEAPQLAQQLQEGDLGEATSYLRLIERLLAGLVPLRGRATEYSVVQTPRGDWIVHTRLADRLQLSTDERISGLDIVGVAQRDHFWQDIRRVLFSKSHFHVMCRVGQAGLRSTWTPVKAIEAFAGIAPDLITNLDAASRLAIAALELGTSATQSVPQADPAFAALERYAAEITSQQGVSLDSTELAEVLPGDYDRVGGSDIHEVRRLFRTVDTNLETKYGIAVDREAAMLHRASALLTAGLLPGVTNTARDVSAAPAPASGSLLVDCEFVAIYW